MSSTLAPPTTPAPPPPWAAAQLRDGDQVTHISAERVVEATSPDARETGRVLVSLELDESVGVPAVRLSGASDTPMLPAQALQLGIALISLAFAAASGQVAR
ncbi:hypothetical protein [Actinoplanes regularis]|uniref:hypothetical protein n=1 Tax=Actinoplanes regularis TaxID=52697 RepID=UPI00249FE313|nr:hypothetical protein [Actinoplanes regularis]GLW32303.1 hypothetical protein Areg01_52420 [Actinoplanes regularis]